MAATKRTILAGGQGQDGPTFTDRMLAFRHAAVLDGGAAGAAFDPESEADYQRARNIIEREARGE